MANDVTVTIHGKETVSGAARSAGQGLGGLKEAVGAVKQSFTDVYFAAKAAIDTIKAIGSALVENAKGAATFNQVSSAFTNMATQAGASADQVLGSLSSVAGGTIAQLDLVKSATRALVFELPIDKLDELMQIARASAAATGESVQKMFDDIVTGIARGSPMILDNLGITIKQSEAFDKMAKSLGKSADELTAAERKQATLNATLAAGADIIARVGESATQLTDLQRWQRFEAAVADTRIELSQNLLPAFRSLADAGTEVATRLPTIFTNLPEIARVVFDEAVYLFSNAFSPEVGGKVFGALWQFFLSAASIAWERIPRLAQLNVERVTAVFGSMWTYFVDLVKWAWNNFPTIATSVLTWLGDSIKRIGPWLADNLSYGWEKFKEFVTGGMVKAKELATDFVASWKEAPAEMPRFGDAFERGVTKSIEAAKQEAAEFAAMLKELATAAAQLGVSLSTVIRPETLAALERLSTPKGKGGGAAPEVPPVAPPVGEIKDQTKAVQDLFSAWDNGSGAVIDVNWSIIDQLQTMRTATVDFSDVLVGGLGDAFEAVGTALVDFEAGWEGLGQAALGTLASILEALGQSLLASAIGKAAAALTLGPGALFAAAATAFIVAGIVRAMVGKMTAMAEGGWITEPVIGVGLRSGSRYLMGEAGPEIVAPPGKLGAIGGRSTVYHVYGNMMRENEWHEASMEYSERQLRGY